MGTHLGSLAHLPAPLQQAPHPAPLAAARAALCRCHLCWHSVLVGLTDHLPLAGYDEEETVRVIMSGNQEPKAVDITKEAIDAGPEVRCRNNSVCFYVPS